jgi:hypothetical protein
MLSDRPILEPAFEVLCLAGLDRRLIVYLGDRPQRTEDGIDVLPLGGFLATLEERSLW